MGVTQRQQMAFNSLHHPCCISTKPERLDRVMACGVREGRSNWWELCGVGAGVLKQRLWWLHLYFQSRMILAHFEGLPKGLMAVFGHQQFNSPFRNVNKSAAPLGISLSGIGNRLGTLEGVVRVSGRLKDQCQVSLVDGLPCLGISHHDVDRDESRRISTKRGVSEEASKAPCEHKTTKGKRNSRPTFHIDPRKYQFDVPDDTHAGAFGETSMIPQKPVSVRGAVPARRLVDGVSRAITIVHP